MIDLTSMRRRDELVSPGCGWWLSARSSSLIWYTSSLGMESLPDSFLARRQLMETSLLGWSHYRTHSLHDGNLWKLPSWDGVTTGLIPCTTATYGNFPLGMESLLDSFLAQRRLTENFLLWMESPPDLFLALRHLLTLPSRYGVTTRLIPCS